MVPLPDDTQLRAATEHCLRTRPELVLVTTGIGFRGWMDAAQSWGLADALSEVLAAATILTRGPKARGAVRARDLREQWSPSSESSTEMLEHVRSNYELSGRRVAVQLHGEPLGELVDGLRAAGADVIEVPVYRSMPPVDEAPLRELIAQTAAGTLDAVAFTSAPAAANFLRTAAAVGADVRHALADGVLCAAVGPVTAAPLEAAGIPVVQPARARLGALAREIVQRLPQRATVLTAAGHRVELRGHALLVDDELIALPAAGMAVLRSLAAGSGRTPRESDHGAASTQCR